MKKLIGHVAVDAGMIWIGDPCYVLHQEKGIPKTLGESWKEFCDAIQKRQKDGVTPFGWQQDRNESMGLCVGQFGGDGEYPVYAEYDGGGLIKRIIIDFQESGQEE